MAIQFKKAERHAVRLKLAVAGPSGSGKTLGALSLAKTLAGDGRFAVIDTENGSASLYGKHYDFDVLDLAPPFTSARYIEAMEAAVDAGYPVLLVDSLSHQWQGEGGILARKEEMDKRPGSNSYTNWATFTKEHTAFVSKLLQLPVHVIVTLRSKQDYVLETNDRGKQTPRKVGLAPVQREGLEYEFSAVFDVGMDHRATASKDRTDLFGDKAFDLVKGSVGKDLLEWLASGAAYVAPVVPAESPAVVEGKADEDKKWQKRTLGERTDDELRQIIEAVKENGLLVELRDSCRRILAKRNPDASLNAALKAEEQFSGSLPF